MRKEALRILLALFAALLLWTTFPPRLGAG
jgi:hypothetical protein